MEMYMKENTNMNRDMDKVNQNTQMEMYMKDNRIMIRERVKVNQYT